MRKFTACVLLVGLVIVGGAWAWADIYIDPVTGYELEWILMDSPSTPPLGLQEQADDMGAPPPTAV